ncbi:MAG: tRNA (adenosine(37)-N6)-threonylcarbamoyltransferase complex dimerization subunit type 1 TsaB [Pseudomonadota bacterium]
MIAPVPSPVLALDASGDACSAAVLTAAGAHSRVEPMMRGHAERLVPMTAELLAEAALDWADLRLIVVARGPGSFTGVRVAVAAARGFALALGRPAIGVDVFDALAAGFAPSIEVETPQVETPQVEAPQVETREIGTPFAVCLGKGSGVAWRGYSGVRDERLPHPREEGRGAPGPRYRVLIGPAAASLDPDRASEGFERLDPVVLANCGQWLARSGAPAPAAPLYLRPPDAAPSSTAPPIRLDRPGPGAEG